MIDFLAKFWLSILLVVLVVITIVILWKQGKKQTVKDFIYTLVCKSEQLFGTKTGDAKAAEVRTQIYLQLPFFVRMIFTQAELENYLKEGCKRLEEMLKKKPGANILPLEKELCSLQAISIDVPITAKPQAVTK